MVPQKHVAWLLTAVAAGAFALGWVCASFRQPSMALPSSPAGGKEASPLAIAGAKADEVSESKAPSPLSPAGAEADAERVAPAFGEAIRSALKLADTTDRLIRLREIIRSLPADQLAGAFEEARRLPQSGRWQVLNALGSRWGEMDLNGALAFWKESRRRGALNESNTFLQGVVEKWAARSPSEALDWVNSLPPGYQRNGAINTLVFTLVRTNPEEALRVLRSLGGGHYTFFALDSLFAEWASRDPQAAVAAASGLDGKSVDVEYVSSTADTVTLRRADGQALRLKLSDLGAADREFVTQQQAKETEAQMIEAAITGEIIWRQPNWSSLSWNSNQPEEIWVLE